MCFGNDDDDVTIQSIQRDARNREVAEEARRLARVVAPAPNPFAALGSRVGVNSISDVLPGERGARVSVSDIKAGIDRSIFSRPSATKPTSTDTDDSKIQRPGRPGSYGGDLI